VRGKAARVVLRAHVAQAEIDDAVEGGLARSQISARFLHAGSKPSGRPIEAIPVARPLRRAAAGDRRSGSWQHWRVELGVHLPLMRFGEEQLSRRRLEATVDAARDCGFAAVSANDHLVFQTPWLDGLTALASVIDRSGEMGLATTVSLPVLRGPVALAKALAAIDVLAEGRLVAALGPGSSERDYRVLGIPFEERWTRFDEALAVLRALLKAEPMPGTPRFYPVPPDLELAPGPHREGGIPLWVGSWGSSAGLARVARAGDGWLASAYNTSPERFSDARKVLAQLLERRGREADGFPNALATMWTWVSKDRADGDRVLADVLAPVLRRDPGELATQVCVGPVGHCAELLSRYAEAGCERVYLWPLGDEARQLEVVAAGVAPQLGAG
jgi:alkanesulfonate monooxygenase SsuD/methylene tetrahydromethanopterin reductase-like flavin-dependent oxidoreductase (luciferase family)